MPLTVFTQGGLTFWGNLLFVSLGSSALCYLIWGRATELIGAVTTSVYLYLLPVVSVIGGALISGVEERNGAAEVRLQCARTEYTAIFAVYGEDGRFLQAETEKYTSSGSKTKEFRLPEGWESYKVMLADGDGCPLCPAWESETSATIE